MTQKMPKIGPQKLTISHLEAGFTIYCFLMSSSCAVFAFECLIGKRKKMKNLLKTFNKIKKRQNKKKEKRKSRRSKRKRMERHKTGSIRKFLKNLLRKKKSKAKLTHKSEAKVNNINQNQMKPVKPIIILKTSSQDSLLSLKKIKYALILRSKEKVHPRCFTKINHDKK